MQVSALHNNSHVVYALIGLAALSKCMIFRVSSGNFLTLAVGVAIHFSPSVSYSPPPLSLSQNHQAIVITMETLFNVVNHKSLICYAYN